MATQNEKNLAYGMQIRLAGMKRRGSPEAAIKALQKKYDDLTKKMKEEK